MTVDRAPQVSHAGKAWGHSDSCSPWGSRRGGKFCAPLGGDRPHKLPDSVNVQVDGPRDCPIGHRGFKLPLQSESSQYLMYNSVDSGRIFWYV